MLNRIICVSLCCALLAMAQSGSRRRGGSNQIGQTGAYNEPAATFHGTLKHLTKSLIVIVTDDEKTVEIRRTHRTKFLKEGKPVKPEDIAIGSALTLDVGKDPDLNPQAVNVVVSGPPQPPEQSEGGNK